MKFSKGDLVTFALGAAVAAVFVLGEALVRLDGQIAVDWLQWSQTLVIAELVSLGRYLTTRLPALFIKA